MNDTLCTDESKPEAHVFVDKTDHSTKPKAAFDNIPACLAPFRGAARWCVWEWRWNGKQWDKPPLRLDGSMGDASKASDEKGKPVWFSLDACVGTAKAKGWGVGFYLKGLPDVVALDLDDCIDESGDIAQWADELVERCGSYTEFSPSGRGLRILGTVTGLAPIHTKLPKADGGQLEIYSNAARYITVTGRAYGSPNAKLADLTHIVKAELGDRSDKPKEKPDQLREPVPQAVDLSDLSLPPDLLKLITGPSDDRSKDFHHACGWMKDIGWTMEQAIGVFERHSNGIAAKYDGRLSEEVARCWGKVEDKQKPAGATQEGNPFLSIYDALDEKPSAFLIDGLMFEVGVGFLAGDSQAGKSFLEVHLGCSIALARDIHGRKVEQPVQVAFALYEGAAGFADRILGWAEQHKVAGADLERLVKNVRLVKGATPPDLMDDKSTDTFISKLKTYCPEVRVVFLDTFGKAAVGIDENVAKEVRVAIRNLQRISDAIGGVAIGLHHFGKDAKRGMKGSASLRADVDMVFELSRRGEQELRLHVKKLKDAEDGFDLFFRKASVESVDPRSGEVRRKTLALVDRNGRVSVADIILSVLEDHPDGITLEDLQEVCTDRHKITSTAFRQSKKRLVDDGSITEKDGLLWADVG